MLSTSLNKKILSILLFISLLFSSFFITNQKADAIAGCLGGLLGGATSAAAALLSVPVADIPNTTVNAGTMTKECGADFIANILKRTLVRALVQDTVNWINNGFEGKPSWGQSLTHVLEDNTHRLLDDFLYSNEYTKGLCKGYELPLKFAIQLKFYTNSRFSVAGERYIPRCTLESAKESIEDVQDFYENNDIVSYSWDKFLEITTNSDNTPFGVYFNLSEDLEREIEKRTGKTEQELNSNSGFLSYRKCDESGWREFEPERTEFSYDSSNAAETFCDVTTPGTQLAASLNKSLGADVDEIITADEFDEIIGALVGQLMKKVLSGGVKGASGSSYDSNYVDPNFEIAKKDLAKRYNINAYKVEENILESSLRTVENVKENQQDAISCWIDKEAGNNQYRKISDGTYERIHSQSYSVALPFLGEQVVEDRFISTTERINRKITSVKQNTINAENAAANILAAKDYGEFIKAKEVAEDIEQANIQQRIQRRDYTNLVFDKMTNGDHTREFTETKEYRLGGFNDSLVYCRSFNIQNPPATYSDGSDERSTIITNAPLKGIEEKHTNTTTIIDSYDPTEDIYDLDEDGYFDDEEIVDVVNPQGACIANDKTVANGVENLSLQFYEPLNIGNCRKATNAKCVDGKFVHAGLPMGVDYPSEFWLNISDDDGNTTECGVKI